MELELYKEDILKIGEYIVSIEGNVGITVDANDNSLGLKEIMMFSRENPAFRRGGDKSVLIRFQNPAVFSIFELC